MEFSRFRNLVLSSLCCLEQEAVKSFLGKQRKLKEMRILIYFLLITFTLFGFMIPLLVFCSIFILDTRPRKTKQKTQVV